MTRKKMIGVGWALLLLAYVMAMLAVDKFAFIHPSPAARTFGDVSYVFVLPTGIIGAVLLLKGWLSKPE